MTTSTAASGQRSIDLKDPSQLLAATPQLLGFRPSDSLLLIGHGPPHGDRVGVVLRGDLPPVGLLRTQAECLVTTLLGSGAVGVTIVVVGGLPDGPEHDPVRVPYAELVDTVIEVLTDAGVPTMHSMWVPEISSGARWACYSDPACGGVLPDIESTIAAAAMASIGAVTYESRDEMRRLLEPADEAAIARRSALLSALSDASGPPAASEETTQRAGAAVMAALRRAEQNEFELTDDQAVELALALANPRVRDACLATAASVGRKAAWGAERLWLSLVRGLPAPERAEAASLLGYATYMRGEGALAGIAFENALDAVPGHILADLLLSALRHGINPERLSGLGKLDGVPDLASGAASPEPRSGRG